MKKIILLTLVSTTAFGNVFGYEKDGYIVFRSPFDIIREIQDEMEQGFFASSARHPATNLIDEGKDLVVEMQVPGFKKDQIEVKIEPRHLVVSGKKEEKKEDKTQKYLKAEAFSSSFQKEMSLPVEIVVEKVTSTLQDGILRIILPKKEAPASKSKIVEIKES